MIKQKKEKIIKKADDIQPVIKLSMTGDRFKRFMKFLMCNNMFRESVVISVKNKEILSIQKEEHGRALRFLKFKEDFFIDITGEKQGIEFEIGKIYKILNGDIKSNDNIGFEIKGNAIVIRHNGNTFRFGYKEYDGEVKTSLPFPMKAGIPVIGDSKIELSTIFSTDIAPLKSIAKYGKKFDSEFVKFAFDNGNIISRVGDLHDFSDYVEVNTGNDIINGDLKRLIVTFGINDIAQTFEQSRIDFYTKNDSPVYIIEHNDQYQHGILLPPFVPETEDE